MTINEITELLIEKLKGEINFLQKEALAASNAGNAEVCGDILLKQGVAIKNLIALVETYTLKNH